MSIYGIGIDIVEIARMKKSISQYGDKFANKVLHPNEFETFKNTNKNERYLAKRFAAKEAFSKALGTGIVSGVTLPRIEVANNDQGKPYLILHDQTKEKLRDLGINEVFLSISDEKNYAVAQVVLEQ